MCDIPRSNKTYLYFHLPGTGFVPTREWLDGWKGRLPLQTILRLLGFLVPQVNDVFVYIYIYYKLIMIYYMVLLTVPRYPRWKRCVGRPPPTASTRERCLNSWPGRRWLASFPSPTPSSSVATNPTHTPPYGKRTPTKNLHINYIHLPPVVSVRLEMSEYIHMYWFVYMFIMSDCAPFTEPSQDKRRDSFL